MEHSFNIEIARMFGVNAAILFNNIYFWTEHNRANEKHYHDGRYWTYASAKSFETLFPYMTTRQIKYALDKLVDAKIILRSHLCEKWSDKMDRTCWYAIADRGYKMLDAASKNTDTHLTNLSNDHFTNLSNGNDNGVECSYITDINNTDINQIYTNNLEVNGTRARVCEETGEAVETVEQTDSQIHDQSALASTRGDAVILGAYNNVKLTVVKYYSLLGAHGMVRLHGKIEHLSDFLHRNPDKARMRYYADRGAVLEKWLKEGEKWDELP